MSYNASVKLCLLGVCAVAGTVTVSLAAHNGTAGVLADDALYLLMADWFSTALGYHAPKADFIWRYSQLPPLYPFTLGLLGADSEHVVFAHVITALQSMGAARAAFLWMRSKRTLSEAACLLLVACWMLLPKSVFESVEAMSEPLYALLSFSTLLAYESATSSRKMYLAAALAACLALARTIGLTMIVAILFVACRQNRPKVGVMAAISLLPVLVWGAINTVALKSGRSYVGDSAHYLMSLPVDEIVRRLFVVWPGKFWTAWLSQFITVDTIVMKVLCALILMGAVIGLMSRLRAASADATYFILYMLVIWFWPYSDHVHRFLWPVIPIFLFYFAEMFNSTFAFLRSRHKALVGGAMLAVALLNWSVVVRRALVELPQDLSLYRGSRFVLRTDDSDSARKEAIIFREFTRAMAIAGTLVPEGDCIVSVNHEIMMLYSRRASIVPPPPYVADAEFQQGVSACRFLFVHYEMSNDAYPEKYPESRMKSMQELARFSLKAVSAPIPIGTLYRARPSG